MDIDRDHVRRELAAIQAEHEATLRPTEDLIDQLYQEEASAQSKWDMLAGGANRSRLLKVGGVAVLTSAVLAACGSDDDSSTPTTVAPGGTGANAADLQVLRFAASVENLAVDAYTKGAGLIKTPAVLDVAKTFLAHHQDHAKLFNGAVKAMGGQEFTTPNPAVAQALAPQLSGLKDEAGVLAFALDLEAAAAATYFSTVTVLSGDRLGYTAMTVGATEYRHAQFLADALSKPVPGSKDGFLTADKALAVAGV